VKQFEDIVDSPFEKDPDEVKIEHVIGTEIKKYNSLKMKKQVSQLLHSTIS
jgi:hypothetical protein